MNATVAWLTFRGLFGRRRFLLLLPLPILLVLAAALLSTVSYSDEGANAVIEGLGFAVVLPVLALIVGTTVLGSEIDDGTVVHILAKPVPRLQIILAKYVIAAGATALAAGLPMLVAGTLLRSPEFGIAVFVGSIVGALAYTGLFIALSLVSRRPVLIGLAYILVWEGLLGRLLAGTRNLSVEQYAISISDHLENSGILVGGVSMTAALILSAIFAIGGIAWSTDRLRSQTLAGETS